ncbi:hypothetical protein H112_06905 [Trichophyton rubrum D6]|uniref:Uncharacterized protein n=4 Tax=Trichophyton TaxID=5550 RepID=A0A178F0H7_TRIRU|nr:hypothetical protein H100_06928 [Trichophyton rubrum MR850]EZF38932.1 hypothetical protein H102_06890 [Trichophyton rubrum CBS 100081]EZF49531.1 hypothetical protein H103_06913 [Trichophyton rubrum CBS 288.86]EZF60158.1 hypothetical protein H104_06868 [Trichophyton rubrum CBS 289.86]EZF70789.1 hypothetical protein H105_06928 [Trichophyton soudanense CBS 452.61]EZF81490.1 hypothetical protein H110_06909 [Trichophyton rubrum MR1448]EZG13659.1 hypothetical protein H107_07069 [Trichophyton rub
MLSIRGQGQENLVNAHQTAAASKPLNQGMRHLLPKTPGKLPPKTPFRLPLQDENRPLTFGKGLGPGIGKSVVLKGQDENAALQGKEKGAEKNTLATPAGMTRAPLGMKTTNAKARAFQTPAPTMPIGTIKQRSAKRGSTRKVKKAAPLPEQTTQERTVAVEEEEEPEREIEYMPPKPKPLPDDDGYITYDTTFPHFKGNNFARGWEKLYEDTSVGEDGLTAKQREEKELDDAYNKHIEELIQAQIDSIGSLELEGEEDAKAEAEECRPVSRATTKSQRSERTVSTLRSKSAAQALAMDPKESVRTRSSARLAAKAAAKAATATTKTTTTKQKKTTEPTNPSSMRHAAAVASSRSTLGYSKGREALAALREGTDQPKSSSKTNKSTNKTGEQENETDHLSPELYMQLYGPPAFGTDMWSRCKIAGYFDDEVKTTEELLGIDSTNIDDAFVEDEESANFQLLI